MAEWAPEAEEWRGVDPSEEVDESTAIIAGTDEAVVV